MPSPALGPFLGQHMTLTPGRFSVTRMKVNAFILNRDTGEQGVYTLAGGFVRGVRVVDEEEAAYRIWRQTTPADWTESKCRLEWMRKR